jgi:acyl carrier protein
MNTKLELTDLFIEEYPHFSSTYDISNLNFEEMGMDWLEKSILIEKVEEQFSIEISYIEESNLETFNDLVNLVEGKLNETR